MAARRQGLERHVTHIQAPTVTLWPRAGKSSDFSQTKDSQWILGSLGMLIGWATSHVIFAAMSGALNAVFVLFADKHSRLAIHRCTPTVQVSPQNDESIYVS